MSQILAKLTYYKWYNFDMACFSLPSLACNKAWGLAKTASVINFINQQARLLIALAGFYPYNPTILIQHSCPAPDYNNGATLVQAGVVRIHFFL
jgi:hypothetical protein